MDVQNLSLSDVFAMSAIEIKAKFGVPINVADGILNLSTNVHAEVNSATPEPPSMIGAADGVKVDGVRKLTLTDADYPKRLLDVLGKKTPYTLYVWGNLELLNKNSVGFCGSRDVSEKGLSVTADAAKQIAEKGWVVVSGHARGVDATAHRVAMENNAGTIIVLPQGINGFKLRKELRAVAKKEKLLVVSEFEPDAKWAVGRAMQRNRTIIGLSDAMILIEARTEGGTFNAGKTAISLNQPLFVANYQESTETNAGNQYFIQRGASQLGKSPDTGRANLARLYAVVEHGSKPKPVPTGTPQQPSLISETEL